MFRRGRLKPLGKVHNRAKAEDWLEQFGTVHIVPAAILSGVYKTHNLMNAQDRGLALFWAHDMAKMIQWIETTRNT